MSEKTDCEDSFVSILNIALLQSICVYFEYSVLVIMCDCFDTSCTTVPHCNQHSWQTALSRRADDGSVGCAREEEYQHYVLALCL